MINLGFSMSQLEAFLLIFIRMSGLFILSPIFGRKNLPAVFKIGFFAYDYFYIVFTYELDIIGFSIEVGNGRLVSVMNTHNCYSNTDMDAYIQRIVEELELRIPDKYLQTHGRL